MIKNQKDLAAGVFFALVAIIGLWTSHDYAIGTATAMEKGYVPRLLLWVLLLLGLMIAARSVASAAMERIGQLDWRPIILVTVAVLGFGLAVEQLGMVIASLLLVGFGGFASRDVRPKELALVGVILAAACAVVFVKFIGLPINVWPRVLTSWIS